MANMRYPSRTNVYSGVQVAVSVHLKRTIVLVSAAATAIAVASGCSSSDKNSTSSSGTPVDSPLASTATTAASPPSFVPDQLKPPWLLIDNQRLRTSKKRAGSVSATWCEAFRVYNNDGISYRIFNQQGSGAPGGLYFDETVAPHSMSTFVIPPRDQILALGCDPDCGTMTFYMGTPAGGEYPTC